MLVPLSPGWVANMYVKNEANKSRNNDNGKPSLLYVRCGDEQKVKDELILCHSTAIDALQSADFWF